MRGCHVAVMQPPHDRHAPATRRQAYEAMRGCPFSDAKVNAIAANYGVGVSQLCLRWVLQHGAALAVGLGSNESKMSRYAASESRPTTGACALRPPPQAVSARRPKRAARGASACPRHARRARLVIRR